MDKMITVEQMNKLYEENQQQKQEEEQSREEARESVLDRIYNTNEPFNYSDIEDIMLGHGLEMDGIEEWF